MDIRLVAGIVTGGSLGLLVVLWLLWKWQDRKDERFVRELQEKIRAKGGVR